LPFIVVDTCVFLRLRGIYEETYHCFMRSGNPDVIAVTREIIKEYKGRCRSSGLDLIVLRTFLQALEEKGKIRNFRQSRINSIIRSHERSNTVNYPCHNKDRKWIRVSVAVRARYIVTTDGILLKTPPNRCNDDVVEVIFPCQYMRIRCPSQSQGMGDMA